MEKLSLLFLTITIAISATSCHEVDSHRISGRVHVDLSYNWDIYGVHSMGEYRYFTRSTDPSKIEPRNFQYNANSYTGMGGLILTCDAENQPLVYERACPYERKYDVIVSIDPNDVSTAVCPECHSRYNVTEFFGAATAGPAKNQRLGLTRYNAYPVKQGIHIQGYVLGQ